jgi:hypothetical protein
LQKFQASLFRSVLAQLVVDPIWSELEAACS